MALISLLALCVSRTGIDLSGVYTEVPCVSTKRVNRARWKGLATHDNQSSSSILVDFHGNIQCVEAKYFGFTL